MPTFHKAEPPPLNLGGRPLGTGGRTIRLVWRKDQPGAAWPGARLFIGRDLWRAIGSPARVDLYIDDAGHVMIRPGQEYAVAGQNVNGQPRIAVSRALAEQLALEPERHITAHVDGDAIISGK